MAYKRPQKSRVSTHKERERLAQEAKNKDIFAVAQQLGMQLQRDDKAHWGGHTSLWLDRKKNVFQWYGKGIYGSPTTLVSVVKFGARSVEDFKKYNRQSIAYLTNTEVPQFDQSKIPKAAPFKYYLKDAASMQLARDYLIKERELSPETVQFFEDKGVLTQSVWKNRLDDDSTFTEPVVVFKHFDGNNKMIGGSVQGIEYHPDIHDDHKSGHLKRVIKNSGAYSGLAVDIGQPRRIVVCEAPIDLLSYYELNKETLKDVKLISSDGYKPHVLSRYVAEMYGNPDFTLSEKEKFLAKFDKLSKTMSGYPENLITFAYDNDEAGRGFIDQFKAQYSNAEAYTAIDLPPLKLGANKADWNDELKTIKKEAQQEASFFSPSKGEMHVEQNRTTNLNFSDFEDEGYSLTKSLENAIYILPDGQLWSGYYPEAPEVRAIEHREIEIFVENSKIGRDTDNFWPLILDEVVMVVPEKQTLLYLETANYTEAQRQKINDYKNLGWEITYEDGISLSPEDQQKQVSKEEPNLYNPEFVSELEKLEAYAKEKGFYLWTRNENWMSDREVEDPSETNTLGADPDINRYEQIIQEQQASLNLLQSQFVELTKQNELIIEKLNQKSVENTEDNQSMKKVGSSTIELAFDQIPRLIQLSKEKLSDVKNHLKDNIKAKSQKGLSVILEKLKVLEILESINKGLDSLSQKVQNLDTQLKVLSGKQVNEKELLLLPAPIQEAAEEIIQKKNVKIGEPTRPQNKFEERLAQAKKDNKATAENYANQKQEVEVSQRVYK